ncbi:MAG: RHS repeat-associated core domain-containing protein [Terracidiphilus sp.]
MTLLPSSGGPVGTVVTINGAGFGSTEGSSSVTVGGLPAVTLAWSDTQIQAQIPTRTGLGTQNIVVTVGGQTISSTTFNVTAGLTGITPPLNSPAGVPGSVTINTSGQNGPLLFYGSQGQIVTVALGNDTLTNWAGSVNMTILNPDGTTLPSNSLCDNPGSGCQLVTSPIVLPHTGLYTLVVDPEGATGSISFTLVLFNNLTGTITPGIPKTSTINIPGQEELLTFIGIASQTATLQISNDSFNTWAGTFTIDIINPDGTALPSSSLCDNAQSGCALITNPVVLPQSGIYTVLVNPGGATGGVTLLLTETASFTINPTSVTLWGSQVQQFTATLNGDTNSAVNWTLTPAMGAGTLSSMGLYTAPASISAQQTVTVTATSVANRTQSVSATVTLIPHGVTVTPSIAVLYSGQAQAFTATCTSSCPASMSWSMIPSGVGTLAPNGLTASYTAPANITAQQTVTITATNPIDNTYVSAVVTLMPPALTPALSLIAVAPSPYPTGASQAFYAILKNRDGTPLSGGAATFTVTGANNNSGSGTTDSTGIATYTYIGVHSGNDVVHATASIGSEQVTSNSVSATWVAPAQSISTSTVTGRFFLSGNSGIFDTPANTPPVFVQTFPSLIFNPPAGTIPGLTTVDNGSRPFTNVTTDVNGNVTGTIAAQGNGYQAGCGPTTGGSCNNNVLGDMYQFQAVFSGEFTVASAGNVVFTYIYDDSFILGIGNGATLVGDSAILNAPAVTAFDQLPVMGSVGLSFTSPTSIVVNFPSPGTYPFEVDYDECCAGSLIMVLTASGTNSTGVPATGSLTLSPNSVNPLPVGGSQTFTVLATDASGNPLPNASVGLVVTGDDELQLSGITDSSGNATIVYNDVNPGTACVQAVAFIDGMVTYSNQVSVPWTLSPGTNTGAGGSDTLSIGISALSPDILPNTLQLNGSATDSALPTGETISGTWSEVSGPGTVSFSLQQSSMNGTSGTYAATATFDAPGAYVLELTASDFTSSNQPLNSGSAQISIEVDPAPPTTQGWIGSPENGAQVSGIVPITVVPGETLNLCVVTVYPANNPNAATTLNCNTGGTSQLASWDTTQVPNGTYWITLQATDSNGNSSYNLALVTVVGSYKPGRVTTTVTDIVVPATGLPIQIQRTYDSLNAATVGDFGYGWNLGINVNLTVDNKGDVTFTLGGQRKTFNLTPTNLSWLFSWYAPVFTPEPGLYGSLTDSSPGCPLDMLLADGECVGGGYYNPPGYIYTDPNGTSYTISAGGQLQSIADRSGNGLTITPNGLTSTTGLNVPFVRDSKNRITQITDPAGNVYSYGYDANGNLASVTYPQTANSQTCPGANASNTSQYSYYPNAEHPNYPAHFYAGGTDGRCYPLPVTTYFDSTNDNGDSSLDGRLASVTDGLGNTTSYAYVLSTTSTINGAEVPNTGVTTITYPKEPADGNGQPDVATMIYDSQGDLLSSTDPLKNTTTNTYDANRNLLSTTDPLGNTTNYTYDANGNKTSITYPTTATSTKTTSITNYNQYSEPTSTIDELGNTRTFNYDVNYNPASVTDSVGTLMSTEFNSSGQMLSGAIGYDINQSPSRASQFTYDAFGNLASKTDALGRTTSYTYNSLGQKTTMTEPIPSGSSAAAATTTYTYDAFGNLTQTSAPLGRVSSSQYDANGNKISDTDARNNTTNYKYDPLNRLIETDYPDGTTATKTYDFRGNVVKETDQDGHVTQHVYDLAGRQVSVTQASGTSNATTTSYAYDNAGRKTSETDALNHTTAYTYDNAGNLLSTSGVAGNFTYTYDNARNRIAMTDGNSNTTQYAYDARKRLTVTTYPDKTAKTNAYDGPGNLISVTDQANNVVQYTYDAANQLINVVQASSPNTGQNTTIYGYDSNGNPIALEDANTHTTNNVFDVLSELTSKTLPDATHTETRTYDNNGNLQSVTHFNNVTTTYTYDALNRLLSRSTPGETPVSFTYTATGKRQTMTDQSGTTTYSYDSMDRLSSKATPEGTLGYTYDAAGNLATMISSNAHGVSTSYRYDDLNRLASVADANLAGSNTTSYTYDNANNVGTVKYPNGIETQFTYDLLNRVSTVNSQVSGYTYQRGPTGNLTSAVELNGRTANWTYDGIYRLTNESIASDPSKNNGSVSYGLDPVGNRSSAVSSLGGVPSGSWGYNVDDEVSSETYDANGNVLLTGGKTFTYDSENHMVTMAAIGTAVTIIYDGDGNRVAKTVNGVTTYYLVDDLNPTGYPQVVEELSGAGVVTRQYTYGLQRIDENQILNNAWTPSFYGYDGGGNVRNLTNAARTVTDSYEYDAYGNLSTVTGSTPNNMLYRGEEYDSDLGLYYLRARYYNPLTGRFMSRDPYEPKFRGPDGKPIDPKNLHKYLYAVGDPVNFRDPSGRASLTEVVLAISMAAGSIFGAPNEVEELEHIEVAVEYIDEAIETVLTETAPGPGPPPPTP